MRTWMPAIHAGMTKSALSFSLGEHNFHTVRPAFFHSLFKEVEVLRRRTPLFKQGGFDLLDQASQQCQIFSVFIQVGSLGRFEAHGNAPEAFVVQ